MLVFIIFQPHLILLFILNLTSFSFRLTDHDQSIDQFFFCFFYDSLNRLKTTNRGPADFLSDRAKHFETHLAAI